MSEAASAYFLRLDSSRLRPTEWTTGAWSTTEQHISPMNGLITHAVERFCAERGPDGMAIGRIGVDILGVLGIEPFEVTVSVVRPGRTIELLEAVVVSAGRAAVRARVWRAASLDTAAVAGGEVEPLPGLAQSEALDLTEVWPGGYIGSVELRSVGAVKPGRAAAWARTRVDLVEGEPASDLARLIGLVDTANGICVRQRIDEWLFPNLDLTIHLLRQPVGDWLGLDTTVVFGPAGHGVTSSVLHDETGHVGYANQTLTIRPR
ncbi:thioesterase family protein [Glycomyces sp. YM15]|uniref:thioesterase family protein n=1 Tax=Glycomyces sp. YM15 TaxID=2800446 RepID=UPI0019651EB9|nr:thioesterase family protein [Glycomyces sp. YM15]